MAALLDLDLVVVGITVHQFVEWINAHMRWPGVHDDFQVHAVRGDVVLFQIKHLLLGFAFFLLFKSREAPTYLTCLPFSLLVDILFLRTN